MDAIQVRGRHHSQNSQGDSYDWSEGEFSDDDEDIYDCPERDESALAEREDPADGYDNSEEIYDTPDDARENLSTDTNLAAQEQSAPPVVSRFDKPNRKEPQDSHEMNNKPLGTISNHVNMNNASNASEEQGEVSFETYDVPKSPVKALRHGPQSQGFNGAAPQSQGFNGAVSPLQGFKGAASQSKGFNRPSPQSQNFSRPDSQSQGFNRPSQPPGSVRPTPRPKPKTIPKGSTMDSHPSVDENANRSVPVKGRWPPSNAIEDDSVSVKGRWPPKPQTEDSGQEHYDTPPAAMKSSHQNIIDKLSKVINTNTSSAAATDQQDMNNSQALVTKPKRREKPFIPANDHRNLRQSEANQQSSGASIGSTTFPMRKGTEVGKPHQGRSAPQMSPGMSLKQETYEVPSDGGQETYEVPQPEPERPPGRPPLRGLGQDQRRMANPTGGASQTRNIAPGMSLEQENYEVPSDGGQETYEVPQPEPERSPGRPPLRGLGQDQRRMANPTAGASQTRNLSPGMSLEQENYEVPSDGGQEAYEVPQPEPGRPPGRPPLRGLGQDQRRMANPTAGASQTRNLSPGMSPEQENYEVPSDGGQETYEVPQPEPGRPPGRPSRTAIMKVEQENYEVPSTETRQAGRVQQTEPQRPPNRLVLHGNQTRGDVPLQVPNKPAKNPFPNESDNSNGARIGRPPVIQNLPGQLPGFGGRNVPPRNDTNRGTPDAEENYEEPSNSEHRFPSRAPMGLPDRAMQGRGNVSNSARPGWPQDPRNQSNSNSAPLPPRNTSESQAGRKWSAPGSEKRKAPQPPKKPDSSDIPSADGQENYEVPDKEAIVPNQEPPRQNQAPCKPMRELARPGGVGRLGERRKPEPVPNMPPRTLPAERRHDAPMLPPDSTRPRQPTGPIQPEEETYEVADSSPVSPEPPPPRGSGQVLSPPPRGSGQVLSPPTRQQPYTPEATMEENYEEPDRPEAFVPPRVVNRPNTLGIGGRAPQNVAMQQNSRGPPTITRGAPPIQEPAEQETYECVDSDQQENYECVDEPTKTRMPTAMRPKDATPAKTPTKSPQVDSMLQELGRKNSRKDSQSSGPGCRAPPEGQENAKNPQHKPLDQLLSTVINGLERPTAVVNPQPPSKEPQQMKRSRPNSIRNVPPRPGSTPDSQDAPLLDFNELSLSPMEATPRPQPRPPAPLPAVPQEQTAEQALKEQSWFQGDMERKAAEDLLKRKGKNGGFIVRNTTKIDGYSISIYHQGSIRHLHIPRKINKFHLGTSEQKFDTVVELVKFFMSNEIELKAGGVTKLAVVL